jgi:hypothetical protein
MGKTELKRSTTTTGEYPDEHVPGLRLLVFLTRLVCYNARYSDIACPRTNVTDRRRGSAQAGHHRGRASVLLLLPKVWVIPGVPVVLIAARDVRIRVMTVQHAHTLLGRPYGDIHLSSRRMRRELAGRTSGTRAKCSRNLTLFGTMPNESGRGWDDGLLLLRASSTIWIAMSIDIPPPLVYKAGTL